MNAVTCNSLLHVHHLCNWDSYMCQKHNAFFFLLLLVFLILIELLFKVCVSPFLWIIKHVFQFHFYECVYLAGKTFLCSCSVYVFFCPCFLFESCLEQLIFQFHFYVSALLVKLVEKLVSCKNLTLIPLPKQNLQILLDLLCYSRNGINVRVLFLMIL